MTSNPGSKRELCKCGHAKATHHKEEIYTPNGVRELRTTCLGVHCDCFSYRDESESDTQRIHVGSSRPKSTGAKPHMDLNCECTACTRWARRNHSWLCTCALCVRG